MIVRMLFGCLLVLLIPFASAEFSRQYLDQHTSNIAQSGDIEIAYKVVGAENKPTVVLIMGLGASHTLWGDGFVKGLEQAGYRIVLIDNRDVGGSTYFDYQPVLWWEVLKNKLGFEINAPYVLDDMAADVIAVMDRLEIQQANIVGASMGGMIAQIVAAEYPSRTQTLVSIMSTTGAPHLPEPSSESSNMIRSLADGDDAEGPMAMMAQRGFYPDAIPRQLMAIVKTGDRSAQVKTIQTPTLVLHGEDDTLLPPAHGEHTASLIQGAQIKIFSGMGHNMPEQVLPEILASMIAHMQVR